MEEEIQIISKIFNIKEKSLNGILSILDTIRNKIKLKFMLNGQQLKIHSNILKLDITLPQNSLYLLQETNISLDITAMLL